MIRTGLFFLFFAAMSANVRAQSTFEFECFCGYLTEADSNCDVCTPGQQARYFKGLLIRKNGAAYKWIEQPYTILQNFDALTFRELIPGAEQIRITLEGTAFDSIAQFRDSVMCPCAGGVGVITLVAGPGINIYGDTIASIPQQVDTFDLVSGAQDTIRLSLTRDSVPFHFVILPPDSDNQYIDTLRLTGTTLEISLFGDNLPLSTVDLSSLVADGSETIVTGANGIVVTGSGTSGSPYVVAPPAGTNTQTLRYNSTTLVANSTLRNNGATIGINTAPASTAQLYIKQATTTDGIRIQRSSSSTELQLYQDANATVQSSAGNLDVKANSGLLSLYGPGGGAFITQIFLSALSNITTTSGNAGLLRFSSTYAPTTAGGDFAFMKFLPAINQTGAANQDIFLIDFNPTLTSVLGQLYGIRYFPSSGRFLWQPNGAGVVVNHLAGNLGIGSGSTTPAQTLHVQGTARITGSSGTATTVTGRNASGDISSLALSGLTISSGTLTVIADGDGDSTNEAWTVDADAGDTEVISNQTVLFAGDGINTTNYDAGTNTLTVTGTEVDGSTTNELQTLANTSDGTSHTATLSNSGGSVKLIEGANIILTTAGTGLDGEVTIAADPALSLNGIYGDGSTPGSGSDTLPPGGSTVTMPGQWQPLAFDMNISGGQVWTALQVNLATCSDDRFGQYFVGKSPSDSLRIYNYDCGSIIDETGGQLTLQTDKEMLFTADSFYISTLPEKTTLRYITGLTTLDYLGKIQGTSTGDVIKWNTGSGGYWEVGSASGGGPTGSGTANRFAYWTGTSTLSSDDDAYFNGTDIGFGSTTMSAKLNVNDGTAFAPYPLNIYGTASSAGGVVYAQVSNLLNTSTVVLSLNQDTTINTIRAGIRKYGTSHASRANELEVFTSVASAPVTISTNSAVRLTAAADGTVHATNKLAGGFATTTGIHSTVQSAGSMAAGYLETVGSPTFDDTKHTVIYTGSTNVTWTLPTSSTCTGRWYVLHHANTSGTITLSQSITKGNGGNFNTLTAGQWAWIVSTGSGWRGYKITSL